MAIKTKPKKQQQPRHAAYAKQRNKRIQQKERLQKARSFNDHGAALGKAGRNEEALQYFEQSLAINPHDIHVLNNYGLTLNVLNRYESWMTPPPTHARNENPSASLVSQATSHNP